MAKKKPAAEKEMLTETCPECEGTGKIEIEEKPAVMPPSGMKRPRSRGAAPKPQAGIIVNENKKL